MRTTHLAGSQLINDHHMRSMVLDRLQRGFSSRAGMFSPVFGSKALHQGPASIQQLPTCSMMSCCSSGEGTGMRREPPTAGSGGSERPAVRGGGVQRQGDAPQFACTAFQRCCWWLCCYSSKGAPLWHLKRTCGLCTCVAGKEAPILQLSM
jgi:hypothetical protein